MSFDFEEAQITNLQPFFISKRRVVNDKPHSKDGTYQPEPKNLTSVVSFSVKEPLVSFTPGKEMESPYPVYREKEERFSTEGTFKTHWDDPLFNTEELQKTFNKTYHYNHNENSVLALRLKVDTANFTMPFTITAINEKDNSSVSWDGVYTGSSFG